MRMIQLNHNRSSLAYRFLFLSLLLCVSAVENRSQDFKQLHPGVEYAQVEHKLGSDPVRINLLRLDLKKVRLDVHHALDKAIGLETTSSIAKRKGAVAAINAGFFRLDKSEWAGDAAGILVADGELVSESISKRVALVILSSKEGSLAEIDHLEAAPRVYSGFVEFPEIDGINRERKKGEMVLYSDLFGQSTRSKLNGVEITMDRCKRKKEVTGHPITVCSRFEVKETVADSAIPKDGYVLSIDTSSGPKFDNFIASMKRLLERERRQRRLVVVPTIGRIQSADLIPGQITVLPLDVFMKEGSGLFVTNGVPQLIKNGKIDITWEQEKASKSFVETRHPRTAVAKLKDGKFLMMTVDGRQPGVSVGMSLQELAEYLFSLGAVDAMNLDGGGSTTMFLDGKVVNTPSDKEGERKIGDAIVVTLRK